MDYSTYEIYDFDRVSAFNMSTGFEEKGMAPGEYRSLFAGRDK